MSGFSFTNFTNVEECNVPNTQNQTHEDNQSGSLVPASREMFSSHVNQYAMRTRAANANMGIMNTPMGPMEWVLRPAELFNAGHAASGLPADTNDNMGTGLGPGPFDWNGNASDFGNPNMLPELAAQGLLAQIGIPLDNRALQPMPAGEPQHDADKGPLARTNATETDTPSESSSSRKGAVGRGKGKGKGKGKGVCKAKAKPKTRSGVVGNRGLADVEAIARVSGRPQLTPIQKFPMKAITADMTDAQRAEAEHFNVEQQHKKMLHDKMRNNAHARRTRDCKKAQLQEIVSKTETLEQSVERLQAQRDGWRTMAMGMGAWESEDGRHAVRFGGDGEGDFVITDLLPEKDRGNEDRD